MGCTVQPIWRVQSNRSGAERSLSSADDSTKSALSVGAPTVAVIIVTHNSAATILGLLEDLYRDVTPPVQVVLVDNDSSDNTIELVQHRAPNVEVVRAGGNLGYAAGINLGLRRVGPAATTIAFLNPDIRMEAGAFELLMKRLDMPRIGGVVPRIDGAENRAQHSIHREPTLLRAIGDAAFGSRRFRLRPAWLSTVDLDSRSYEYSHPIDWATGAAVLVRREVVDRVGDWDESFFLYSEETDYFRRIRKAGSVVWFESDAHFEHVGGASGRTTELHKLRAVNKVRYIRAHRGRFYAACYRLVLILHQLVRSGVRHERDVLLALLNKSSWKDLPGATYGRPQVAHRGGSIIVPAHNEEAVIGRLLSELQPIANTGEAEIIVACNGCTDGTVALARSYADVKTIELDRASKIDALNTADRSATRWPRVYVDADIEVSADALLATLETLHRGPCLAARPAFRYDSAGASWPVHAYYRARREIGSANNALWGAGIYGLSRQGHARVSPFPEVVGDDLYIDEQFLPDEKAVVATKPAVVRTPRTIGALLAILARAQRGRGVTIDSTAPSQSAWATSVELARTVRGPRSALDAMVYATMALGARAKVRRRHTNDTWGRDHTSRDSPPSVTNRRDLGASGVANLLP